MGKSLGLVIVCLRKIHRSSSRNFYPRKEDLVRKSKVTGTPAETVDISSVMHRSLYDPFAPTHRQGSVLSRLSTLALVRSHRSQQRSSVGVSP